MYRYDRLGDTPGKDAGGVKVKPPEQPATPGTQAPLARMLPQPAPPLAGTLASDGTVGGVNDPFPSPTSREAKGIR